MNHPRHEFYQQQRHNRRIALEELDRQQTLRGLQSSIPHLKTAAQLYYEQRRRRDDDSHRN